MASIRVLVVDDSAVMRRALREALAADPEIEVAGVAANGRIALSLVSSLSPDLVTMDVEMPELDGLGTLVELRKTHPNLPVIMFSSLTRRAASTTLEALSRGATDYLAKPMELGAGAWRAYLEENLLPKVKALGRKRAPKVIVKAPARVVVPSYNARVEVVAVGASTGGPNALGAVLAQLPKPWRVPILITQHMPPVFTRLLAERLERLAGIPICEAEEGMLVEPGHGYVAMGDRHLILEKKGNQIRLKLDSGPPQNSCRPAVDPMFRSVGEVYGAGVLAVVLTGMGQDGLRGAEVIRELGGRVLVQDENTSVVWGMPGAIARAGLAEQILPLEDIGGEIVRRVEHRNLFMSREAS